MTSAMPSNFQLTGDPDTTTEDDQGQTAVQDPVWGDTWNPHQNRWAPSDTPVDADADTAVHGDVHVGTPISEQYGYIDPGGGSIEDARANLLTDVKPTRGPVAPPMQVVKHEVQTISIGAEKVRARTVVVTTNNVPVTLLDENPNRTRALIKVITTSGIIMIQPLRGGNGAAGLTATPAGNVQGWQQATGDPLLTIESQAGVECYGVGAVVANTNTLTTPVTVTVWEEIASPNGPGLAV